MNWLFNGQEFLGIHWNFWKVVGWMGNAAFFSRFIVQWYASEKSKRVVVPPIFWWLSLAGSFCLLSYAIFYRQDSVFIFAYAFTWIPYIRNLMIHHRAAPVGVCSACASPTVPLARFCSHCGAPVTASAPVENRAS
jgi:lipid-A-disaccharide synthase-like uncharacterized protein